MSNSKFRLHISGWPLQNFWGAILVPLQTGATLYKVLLELLGVSGYKSKNAKYINWSYHLVFWLSLHYGLCCCSPQCACVFVIWSRCKTWTADYGLEYGLDVLWTGHEMCCETSSPNSYPQPHNHFLCLTSVEQTQVKQVLALGQQVATLIIAQDNVCKGSTVTQANSM